MTHPLTVEHCPVCGQSLLAVINLWEPSDDVHRHEGVHVDDVERVNRGLPARVCSWAEPMAVALRELAFDLSVHVRMGEVDKSDIEADCRPEVVRMVHAYLAQWVQ